jgi:hypothetical protein
MYGVNNLPPFGTPGPAAILTAINKEQGITLTSAQVTVGAPVATTGDTLFNTSVTLTSIPNKGFKGTFTARYNRVSGSLSAVLNNLTIPGDGAFTVGTTHDLIPLINTATGLTLVTGDIVNEAIPVGTNSVDLKAASTSYFFLPGSTFKVYAGEIAGEPWMLFDVNSLTDVKTTGSTGTLASAAQDNTYLIDGEPTLKITGTGSLTINLGQLFDSSIPEWTLEWSSRLNTTTTGYANLLRLGSATAYQLVQRTSDSGFGLRIQQGIDFSTQAGAWNFPFGSVAKNGVLTRYAAQKKNGLITMFVDGKATNMANGTGSTYNSKSFSAGAGVAACDRITLGLLAQNISHVRLSKFARYPIDYTPKPFKSAPTLAQAAPNTDLSGFDPA